MTNTFNSSVKRGGKSSARHQLPISVKAYSQYLDRFKYTFCEQFPMPELYDECVALLDGYLAAGTMPDESVNPYVRMAFALLKPEIDKSIARSKAARERAAIRRANKNVLPVLSPAPEAVAVERKVAPEVPNAREKVAPKRKPILQRVKHKYPSRNRNNNRKYLYMKGG